MREFTKDGVLCRFMQCKDIKEEPILEFVFNMPAVTIISGIRCPILGATLTQLSEVMGANLPFNLVRAKLKQLVKNGYLEGCTCGCRGDFTITRKGVESLFQHHDTKL
jgi:hypothetical protein